jgi:hypothetical protein
MAVPWLGCDAKPWFGRHAKPWVLDQAVVVAVVEMVGCW